MKFIKTEDAAAIGKFRADLYQSLLAPLDAMWESLYIGLAQNYIIEKNGEDIGYCCIDEGDSLLQIYLTNEHSHLMEHAVQSLINSKLILSAKLSSIEPISFNACISHSKSIQTNTFCFQYSNRLLEKSSLLNITQALENDISEIRTFLKEQIGFNDNFGYTENLVKRNEFFVVRESREIIATSECRMSDSQPEYADLGVIVNKNFRGKGIATKILLQQAKRVLNLNRKPICSTTYDNIASKKAIEKAGFYCAHIIFNIHFTEYKTQ